MIKILREKQCKPRAMSLLGWPRRSLLSIKEVQAERHGLTRMAEAQPAFYKSSRRRYRNRNSYQLSSKSFTQQ